jgi:hypothetical protein
MFFVPQECGLAQDCHLSSENDGKQLSLVAPSIWGYPFFQSPAIEMMNPLLLRNLSLDIPTEQQNNIDIEWSSNII